MMKQLLVLSLLCSAMFFTACSDDDNGGTPEPPELLPRQSLAESDQTLSLYSVDGNTITFESDFEVDEDIIRYRNDKSLHDRMWTLFEGIVPSERRTFVKRFTPFHGGDVIGGYVYPLNNSQRTEWTFGLDVLISEAEEANVAEGGNPSLPASFTTIHEYGHLLSLFADQLDLTIAEADCDNFFGSYGCLTDDSILQAYFDAFWAADFEEYETALSEVGDDGISAEWFSRYPDSFHTQYAATDPQEDFSESIAAFVFGSEPSIINIDVKDDKLRFFWDIPEMVTLREGMRDYIRDNVLIAPGSVPGEVTLDSSLSSGFAITDHRSCGLARISN